ncbi:MAG: ribosome biogenesis GTP-binding protein YihA/YsxC [Kofleriaceae bacterium]
MSHRTTVELVASAAEPSGFPAPSLPEVAVVGRSNVGKSSLINTLVAKDVAHTSRTPGRTRLLHWFRVKSAGHSFFLVDLPGYGYAEVPKGMRASWQPLIESYLNGRSTLRAVLLLLDIRRGVQEEELDFVPWLLDAGIDVVPVLTKADKLAKNKRAPVQARVRRELELRRVPLAVSALSADGIDELWRLMVATTR